MDNGNWGLFIVVFGVLVGMWALQKAEIEKNKADETPKKIGQFQSVEECMEYDRELARCVPPELGSFALLTEIQSRDKKVSLCEKQSRERCREKIQIGN